MIAEKLHIQVRLSKWDTRVISSSLVLRNEWYALLTAPSLLYRSRSSHFTTFDFWPTTQHALLATPRGEVFLSVEAQEKRCRVTKDEQVKNWKQQRMEPWIGERRPYRRGTNTDFQNDSQLLTRGVCSLGCHYSL